MSEFNPSEVTTPTIKSIPKVFEEDAEELEPPSGARRPGREGLPSGYRMRADEHYVEQLTSRRPDRRAGSAVETASAVSSVEATYEAGGRLQPDVLAHLAEALAIIENTSALLAVEASPLTRRVSADLIRAQAWRASWALQATRLLGRNHRVYPKTRQLGVLFAQIRDRFSAECRLSGVSLRLHASDWTTAVVVDDAQLVTGISGAILAVLALVGDAEGVTIRVSAVAAGGDLRTIEIAQDDVPVPADLAPAFFDPFLPDRPGGLIAGLGASAARVVAENLGGDASFVVGDRAGCTIRMNLNRPF